MKSLPQPGARTRCPRTPFTLPPAPPTSVLREAARQQRRGHASVARREELAGKMAAAAAAEDAKMAQFRALLQSQAGPIQIAKRQ